ncbi:MAG: hypothetical protein PUA59_09575 [Clostridium sp.]|nr:hypothetical protein [Clostridium sp.]
MKHKHLLVGVALGLALLTGCAVKMDTITVNTMIIEKKGTISDISVEDFSGGSYDMAGLEQYVTDEIDSYNQKAGADSVVMKALDTENPIVKVQLTYQDMDSYNGFNDTAYELKNLAEETLTGSFTAADGSTVNATEINGEKLKVLKVSDAMDIIYKGKVLYYNQYVTENDGTYTASGEGEAVLVLK